MSLLGTPGTPGVREAEVEIQVKLLGLRNHTKSVFQEVILI